MLEQRLATVCFINSKSCVLMLPACTCRRIRNCGWMRLVLVADRGLFSSVIVRFKRRSAALTPGASRLHRNLGRLQYTTLVPNVCDLLEQQILLGTDRLFKPKQPRRLARIWHLPWPAGSPPLRLSMSRSRGPHLLACQFLSKTRLILWFV